MSLLTRNNFVFKFTDNIKYSCMYCNSIITNRYVGLNDIHCNNCGVIQTIFRDNIEKFIRIQRDYLVNNINYSINRYLKSNFDQEDPHTFVLYELYGERIGSTPFDMNMFNKLSLEQKTNDDLYLINKIIKLQSIS